VPRHAGDRQSDAVDISGSGEVALLGGRHTEFGAGDEQRPPKQQLVGRGTGTSRVWGNSP